MASGPVCAYAHVADSGGTIFFRVQESLPLFINKQKGLFTEPLM